jgi:hypothetical protein
VILWPAVACIAWWAAPAGAQQVEPILDRVRQHDFHPTRGGFTSDRVLGKAGIASLDDADWKVRTLAVRDLVKAGRAADGQ